MNFNHDDRRLTQRIILLENDSRYPISLIDHGIKKLRVPLIYLCALCSRYFNRCLLRCKKFRSINNSYYANDASLSSYREYDRFAPQATPRKRPVYDVLFCLIRSSRHYPRSPITEARSGSLEPRHRDEREKNIKETVASLWDSWQLPHVATESCDSLSKNKWKKGSSSSS